MLFTDIYKKAVRLFDDPEITEAYEENQMKFCKLMYQYLQNGIYKFKNPVEVAIVLSNSFTAPLGLTESFTADGTIKSFAVSEEFDLSKLNCIYQYTENGKVVQGVLEDNIINFPNTLPLGGIYCFEQYYVGEFIFPLNYRNNNLLLGNIQDILSHWLVRAWAEESRNYLLDIQNLLYDTDFKLHSASSNLIAKNSWIKDLDGQIAQYQNDLAWLLEILKNT